jgi:4-oxalocrotonate tautomerase
MQVRFEQTNRKNNMPYIKVQVTRQGVTAQQKRDIIAGVTRLMQDVLNKDPQLTHVVIQEIETDNWGVGGKPVTPSRPTAAQP